MRCAIAVSLAVAALLAGPVAGAPAGVFGHLSCGMGGEWHRPTGWTHEAPGAESVAAACGSGGAASSNGDVLRYRAPAGARVVGVSLPRGERLAEAASVWADAGEGTVALGLNGGGRWEVRLPRPGVPELTIRVGCGAGGRERCATVNRLSFTGMARVDLLDETPPRVTRVGGDLFDADFSRALLGRKWVVFDATDDGSGLGRVIARWGDHEEEMDPLNPYRLEQCSGGGWLLPRGATACPAWVEGFAARLDPWELPSGNRDLSMILEDGVGNRTVLFGPRAAGIDNQPWPGWRPGVHDADRPMGDVVRAPIESPGQPPVAAVVGPAAGPAPAGAPATPEPLANGYRATPDAQLTGAAQAVAYGRGATVRGALVVPGGRRIIGARIEVDDPAGGRAVVVTDRLGQFTHRAAPGSSRTVHLSYHATPTAPPRGVDVAIRVRAGVRLAGRRGRVLGVAGGVRPRVVLQVRRAQRWRTVATVHTVRGGSFAVPRRVRGTVRALVRRTPGFPYEPAASR